MNEDLKSSIVNKVIRIILNLFVFFTRKFYTHIHTHTHTQSIKSIKSTKRQTSDSLPLRCFYDHKKHKTSNERLSSSLMFFYEHKKHKKHKKWLSFSQVFFMSIKSTKSKKNNIKCIKMHTSEQLTFFPLDVFMLKCCLFCLCSLV